MTAFGLSLGISAREPVRRIGQLSKRAEELGFDAMWLIDSQLVMADVYCSLAVAAVASESIKLGTGVTNPYTRHVTVTCNAIASLDELSGSRALLGIGSGDSAVRPLGLEPAGVKSMQSFVEGARLLLDGEPLETPSGRVSIGRPRPGVPIFIAASQPRMLELAARVADGVILLGFADPEVISWQLGYVRKGLEAAGRDVSTFFIDYWATISMRDSIDAAVSDVRSWCAGQARWLNSWKEKPPILASFASQAQVAADRYDFSEHLSLRAQHASTVSEDFVRVAAIAGPREHCLQRVAAIAAYPEIDRITLTLLSGGRESRLEALGELCRSLRETTVSAVGGGEQ